MFMDFDSSLFAIGFWHPFGPHSGETPEEILDRKKDEVSKEGWTLCREVGQTGKFGKASWYES
jgi:hypothetical protein